MYRPVYTSIYWYIPGYTCPGTVQTSIYRFILCTDWYIQVYTGIYSDILLCAGFSGAHPSRDAMMHEPSTVPEPQGWDREEEESDCF